MLRLALTLLVAVLRALPLFEKWRESLEESQRAREAADRKAAKDKRNAAAIAAANEATKPKPPP